MESKRGCPTLGLGGWVLGFPMPKGLHRYYGRHHLHFITFSCYRRLPLLKTARSRDVFVQELARARADYGFLLVGYVVMPEHVHLLISEPRKGTPSTALQMLKQRVSKKLRKKPRRNSVGQLRLAFPEPVASIRSFWQARFYDFNVYTNRKKREKLEYMHRNPLTRGLVKHPKDWPWSSWPFYGMGKPGPVGIDVVPE
ncbi:MAG TPA: transposase [Candidatus Limnocylindrales bacterium]|nr:transposase [Candidatus Limnocylindrales bacterium]